MKICKLQQVITTDNDTDKYVSKEDFNILVAEMQKMRAEMLQTPKNTSITNNIQQNIISLATTSKTSNSRDTNIRDFGNENMDAIPDDFIASCFMNLRYRDLLENLHYDPDFPENHNIRIKSVKRNMLEMYKNNRWNVVTLRNGLEELIQQGTKIFKAYVHTHKQKILEEDMNEDELQEVMEKLTEIDEMHKLYINDMSSDIQAMIESYNTKNTLKHCPSSLP
jgi:hypothetical protein